MIADPYRLVEEKLDRRSKRNVLITGCNGYLGVGMCHSFSMWGWDVFGVDLYTLTENKWLTGFCQMSISELRQKLWDVDAVIHLAGASVADDRHDEAYYTNTVEATQKLRRLYPHTPILFASVCAMYNEAGEIEHKHRYSQTKELAEREVDQAFRMASICGANPCGHFATVVDLMIDSAYKHGYINIAEGDKYRPVASIDYICDAYRRYATLLSFDKLGSAAINLWNAVATIDDIGEAVAGLVSYTTRKEIGVRRQDDLSQIDKKQPRMSIIPPGCDIIRQRRSTLLSVIQNAIERYEKYVVNRGSDFGGRVGVSADAADRQQAEVFGQCIGQTHDPVRTESAQGC